MMMDPNADPFAAAPAAEVPAKFGASDVQDLNWVQLLNACYLYGMRKMYLILSLANQTGKTVSS
jgi:hypothetical protein